MIHDFTMKEEAQAVRLGINFDTMLISLPGPPT
jgi:hypothetical protein